MARFMADRAQPRPGGQRYDREGLYHWAQSALRPRPASTLTEEDFRTAVAGQAARDAAGGQPKALSRPSARRRSTRKLEEAFEGAKRRRGRRTPRSWPSG